mgnify:CR=1 FL=1
MINDSIYIEMESGKSYIKLIKQTLEDVLQKYLKDTKYIVKTTYGLNWLDGFEITLTLFNYHLNGNHIIITIR